MQAFLVVGTVLGTSVTQHERAAQAAPDAKAAIDPKADALLRKMSADLAAMKNFRFDASHILEVVTKEGEKIQGLAESSVVVQRPNKLHSDRKGPLGGARLYYDGKNLSIYGKRENLYATAKAPDTLDATIDYARDQLSLDAPGADLLYSDPYTVLMEDVVSGKYMGIEPVGNRMCHHLAYRANETDWQIWVEDGARALPCRFVITSKKVQGSPTFTVTTSNWKVERPAPAEMFTFRAPPNATKIDFVTVKDDVEQKKQQVTR